MPALRTRPGPNRWSGKAYTDIFGGGTVPAAVAPAATPVVSPTPIASSGSPATGTSSPGVLPGAAPYNWSGPYGGIPATPDPLAVAKTATEGNIANVPGLENLGDLLNKWTTDWARQQYELNFPNYGALTEAASTNIGGNLAGTISPDVLRNLEQMAAERGVTTGIGAGSPNETAALLRALGLTTMDLQNLGQQQLNAAIARTPTGPMFNPASMLTSPSDLYTAQMQANWGAAAPIPAQKAAAELEAMLLGRNYGIGATRGTGATNAVGPTTLSTSPGIKISSIPGSSAGYGTFAAPKAAPTAPGAVSLGRSIPGFGTTEYTPGIDMLDWNAESSAPLTADEAWIDDFLNSFEQGTNPGETPSAEDWINMPFLPWGG